ncbi:hypothetical protein L6452_24657 [Arctium lappa]|uniref:Uncharacterized protein n=1 Tax=Arctium lappa TaxID=4217 RepID=A0ACB9AAU4_ARCLA|nr:hypothetical protein L6452_24657 [Arctium lappa]
MATVADDVPQVQASGDLCGPCTRLAGSHRRGGPASVLCSNKNQHLQPTRMCIVLLLWLSSICFVQQQKSTSATNQDVYSVASVVYTMIPSYFDDVLPQLSRCYIFRSLELYIQFAAHNDSPFMI